MGEGKPVMSHVMLCGQTWLCSLPIHPKGGRGIKRVANNCVMWLMVSCALQDEEGKILLTFPQPMHGFRDFLFFDEELQITIGNRGSLVIIQR